MTYPEEEGDQHQVADESRAPVGHEREGYPCQGDQSEHSADDQERLDPEDERQTGREQLAKRVATPEGDSQPDSEDQPVERQNRDGSRKPQFFADCGKDEVGLGVGDQVGPSQAGPGAGERAATQGEQSLGDLETGVLDVLARLEQYSDPPLHVVEGVVAGETGDHREQSPGEQVPGRAGGGIEKQHEAGE